MKLYTETSDEENDNDDNENPILPDLKSGEILK
jgi:hypothetical protein